MKTYTTKKLETLLEQHFNKRNEFYVFECTIGWYGSEIVDCIMYNCKREIICYEIKQSVNDLHSKNKLTFIGNKNYFVMPYSLYEKVKTELYKDYPDVGIYVAIDRLDEKEETRTNEYGATFISHWSEPVDGLTTLYCIKSARRQDLKADKEVILSSMLRSMQRDFPIKLNYEFEEGDLDVDD